MSKIYRCNYDNVRLVESGEERYPKKGEYYHHLISGIIGKAAADITEEANKQWMEETGINKDIYKILVPLNSN